VVVCWVGVCGCVWGWGVLGGVVWGGVVWWCGVVVWCSVVVSGMCSVRCAVL